MALNWVTKCIQKPSRVPGCPQLARRLDLIVAKVSRGPRMLRCSGASWTTTATAAATATLTAAAMR